MNAMFRGTFSGLSLNKIMLMSCHKFIQDLIFIVAKQPLSIQTEDEHGPLWTASSTQTSPRVVAALKNPVCDGGPCNSEESLMRPCKSIPKLGEIEQFSTETQTVSCKLAN